MWIYVKHCVCSWNIFHCIQKLQLSYKQSITSQLISTERHILLNDSRCYYTSLFLFKKFMPLAPGSNCNIVTRDSVESTHTKLLSGSHQNPDPSDLIGSRTLLHTSTHSTGHAVGVRNDKHYFSDSIKRINILFHQGLLDSQFVKEKKRLFIIKERAL